MIYCLPVLALLGGALIGSAESSALGWDGSSATVVGSGAGLAVGFGLLMGLDRCKWIRRRLAPRITTILVSDEILTSSQ